MIDSISSVTRRALLALTYVVLQCLTVAAFADTFPSRPVMLVVPYPPGGGADILARAVAQQLGQEWKQPVIVESKPGGGTMIAADYVARAKPDGYTLLLSVTQHAIAVSQFKKQPYNYLTDLAAVALLSDSPFILVVPPNSTVQSFPQLVDLIKSKGSALNFGSSGLGSVPHLSGEMLNRALNAKAAHIPYPGTAPAFAALMGGQIDYLFGDTSVLPSIKAGKVKALAVTTGKRSPSLPDVPAMSEFLPGFSLSSWVAIEAPAATPRAVVIGINASIQKILKSPELVANYEATAKEPLFSTPDQFTDFKVDEVRKFQKLIADIGMAQE
ncbi:Bug family tripartite tricarboxylate transporter substrate binding protein [Pigmentiphaga litoralis]|uniref:Bug family tripartite tricarboxylate transporter substrate binding protein n=1 Tax=Pigmentiphaga litoralis TaxID=516702 RepID=UPI003B4351E0